MTKPTDDQLALEYTAAVCAALDEVSLKYDKRGDMGAALAALCAAQAQLIGQLPEGRTRKFMRLDCGKKLLQYITAYVGDDKRGVSKPTMEVLPPKVH